MAEYTVRKTKGPKSLKTKKNISGYAIYYKDKKVSPHFINWFPTKAAAEKRAKSYNQVKLRLSMPRYRVLATRVGDTHREPYDVIRAKSPSEAISIAKKQAGKFSDYGGHKYIASSWKAIKI